MKTKDHQNVLIIVKYFVKIQYTPMYHTYIVKIKTKLLQLIFIDGFLKAKLFYKLGPVRP